MNNKNSWKKKASFLPQRLRFHNVSSRTSCLWIYSSCSKSIWVLKWMSTGVLNLIHSKCHAACNIILYGYVLHERQCIYLYKIWILWHFSALVPIFQEQISILPLCSLTNCTAILAYIQVCEVKKSTWCDFVPRRKQTLSKISRQLYWHCLSVFFFLVKLSWDNTQCSCTQRDY